MHTVFTHTEGFRWLSVDAISVATFSVFFSWKHRAARMRSLTVDRLQLDCTNKWLTRRKWNDLKFCTQLYTPTERPHLFLFLLLLLLLRPALIRELEVLVVIF